MLKRSEIIGYSIIFFIIFIFSVFIFLIIFEYLGFAKNISEKNIFTKDNNASKLLEINYYENNISRDPYENFQISFIHPYFMFSLPWKKKEILKLSNSVVSINDDGFRVNPKYNKLKHNALILGGSTAFGHFSSSDLNTFSAKLTESTKFTFINRNAPNWNSHQESIALLKFKENYSLSLSLSLANDISSSCDNNLKNNEYLDMPDPTSFNMIYNKFHENVTALRETVLTIKKIIEITFPYTINIYRDYRASKLLNQRNKNEYKKNIPSDSFSDPTNQRYDKDKKIYMKFIETCDIPPENIAENYLFNQLSMSQISKSRGANHVIILQPFANFHKDNFPKNHISHQVYSLVMNSDYCKNNLCLDLNRENLEIYKIYNLFFSYDDADAKKSIFIDNLHLTDLGVGLYSSIISKFLNENLN